ncbi:hypothetical protein AJ87_39840 [Rhizobium yanglingense]|nr:hypothetical protein AJ87_39840 [Rhizobium yanglingense]
MPSPWAVAAMPWMSLAGRLLRVIASRIASTVALHNSSMSRSIWRAFGINCVTRRRATASGVPSISKMTALVTVRPLSIPSRLGIRFYLAISNGLVRSRAPSGALGDDNVDISGPHAVDVHRLRLVVDDDGVELVQCRETVKRPLLELRVIGKQDALDGTVEHGTLGSTVSGDWCRTVPSLIADMEMNATSALRPLISFMVMRPMKALHQL